MLKEKIVKLIEGGLQLSEYQARKVPKMVFKILKRMTIFKLFSGFFRVSSLHFTTSE